MAALLLAELPRSALSPFQVQKSMALGPCTRPPFLPHETPRSSRTFDPFTLTGLVLSDQASPLLSRNLCEHAPFSAGSACGGTTLPPLGLVHDTPCHRFVDHELPWALALSSSQPGPVQPALVQLLPDHELPALAMDHELPAASATLPQTPCGLPFECCQYCGELGVSLS